jgi:hypothetical protein
LATSASTKREKLRRMVREYNGSAKGITMKVTSLTIKRTVEVRFSTITEISTMDNGMKGIFTGLVDILTTRISRMKGFGETDSIKDKLFKVRKYNSNFHENKKSLLIYIRHIFLLIFSFRALLIS